MSDTDGRHNARRRILHALREEMRHRNENPDHWVEDERMAVVLAANEWAMGHGLRIVTASDIERVEQLAVGHVDYAEKLALYASELIYGYRVVP